MTPEEAMGTDPQQRILLETTYRALENGLSTSFLESAPVALGIIICMSSYVTDISLAGIPLDSIDGSDTSVHTGCFTADYSLTIAKDPEYLPKYAATGAAGSMLSNRISTFFGLTGPSITVDTACSSSLVALDLACQAIKDGRSKMVRALTQPSLPLFTASFLLSSLPLYIDFQCSRLSALTNTLLGDCSWL